MMYASHKPELSNNANFENSLNLFRLLIKEYPIDSIMHDVQEKRRFVVLCRVNLCGKVVGIEKIRSMSKVNSSLLDDKEKLKSLIINSNYRFLFPYEISGYGDVKKEMSLQKKYIKEQIKQKGYYLLPITYFDAMFILKIVKVLEGNDNYDTLFNM